MWMHSEELDGCCHRFGMLPSQLAATVAVMLMTFVCQPLPFRKTKPVLQASTRLSWHTFITSVSLSHDPGLTLTPPALLLVSAASPGVWYQRRRKLRPVFALPITPLTHSPLADELWMGSVERPPMWALV